MGCAVLRYVLTHLRVVQDVGAGQLALLAASGQGFDQSLASPAMLNIWMEPPTRS